MTRTPRESNFASTSNAIVNEESGGKDRLTYGNNRNAKEESVRKKRKIGIIQHLTTG